MTTANQRKAKSTRIEDHLGHRPQRSTVARQLSAIRSERAGILERYHGGLPAEQKARTRLLAETVDQTRRLILSRHGRRINLVALLRQKRRDGRPRWTVASPHKPVGASNGVYDGDGDLRVQWNVRLPSGRTFAGTHYIAGCGHTNVRPGDGFPALPPRVRELARDPKILERAAMLGVLYQPDEWRDVDPDPALVVKWRGVEGYYALAVWGGDRAEIMEFVD